MAHLLCKCGEDMWNGYIPNDIEYWVYSDRQMDLILGKDEMPTLDFAELSNYKVWRCPSCKRLYIFDDNSNEALYIYKLENEKGE